MPMAASDVRWVEEPKIGLLEQLYLPAIMDGLTTTVKHLFGPKITAQYPEVHPKLPATYRGVHRLNRDAEGRVKCVACYMCSTACPAHCIDIVAAPSPWPDREKYPEMFVIDEDARSLMLRRASARDIRVHAIERGMTTLRLDGWQRACEGVTTVEEILRVTQEDAS